jgi:hypothetical protein
MKWRFRRSLWNMNVIAEKQIYRQCKTLDNNKVWAAVPYLLHSRSSLSCACSPPAVHSVTSHAPTMSLLERC